MRKLAVLIAVIGLAAGWYTIKRRHTAPAESSGKPVPVLRLSDLNGATVDTASFRGRVVLINFWAAWCTPCRGEIPQFVALQDKYGGQGFQAVGISMEDPEGPLRDFYREYKMNYPVVMGDQKLAEEFGGVMGLPTTFLVGRDGRVHGRYVGATDFPKLEQEILALLRSRG